MRTEITLQLGYSPIYTPESEYREFFEYLFGSYTELQLDVAVMGTGIERLRVTGSNLRRPHRLYVEEEFIGREGSKFRTKNGHVLKWNTRFDWRRSEVTLAIVHESQTLAPPTLAAAE